LEIGDSSGDQIISYNGKPVAGPLHLERLVMETEPGRGVPIRVKRESITVSTEALAVGRQPVSRNTNPQGLLAGAGSVMDIEKESAADEALFEQIQRLEREISRLRVLMEKK